MEIEIEIPASYLAVLKLFAAKDDIRHALNGVSVEVGPHETHLFACDGTRVAGFRVVSEQPDLVEPLKDIVIPIEMLPQRSEKHIVQITIGEQIDVGYSRSIALQAFLADGATKVGPTTLGKTLEAPGMDIRRVLSSKLSGETAQFNPTFFADFVKAAKLLGVNPAFITVTHNGDGPALVTLGGREDFVGAMSPIRSHPQTCFPAWAGAPLLARKQEAA